MAAYQDVNGVRCNMMRLYAGDVPEAQAARELLYLLRLPFLPEAYESIQPHLKKQAGYFSPSRNSPVRLSAASSLIMAVFSAKSGSWRDKGKKNFFLNGFAGYFPIWRCFLN